MKNFVIFGICSLLTDIFDMVHDTGGKVSRIYLNMPEVKNEREPSLQERVSLLGYPVEIHDSLDSFKPEKGFSYIIGTTTPRKHRLVAELKKAHSLNFSPLIHSSVHLGSHVHIGEGVMINARSTIGPAAYLDDHCVINRCVSIGHDSQIGKYSNIAPSVSIAGSTTIGDGCRIGISATILDHICVGNRTTIGAAALVNKDIPDGVVAYGIPAVVKRENPD